MTPPCTYTRECEYARERVAHCSRRENDGKGEEEKKSSELRGQLQHPISSGEHLSRIIANIAYSLDTIGIYDIIKTARERNFAQRLLTPESFRANRRGAISRTQLNNIAIDLLEINFITSLTCKSYNKKI